MSGIYQLIYADCPWTYQDKCHSGERGAGYKYDLMTVEQLCDLRPMIDDCAAPDCLLAMWWVPPQPAEALKVVEAWGFKFKTMKGFSWFKTTTLGKEHFGMGNLTRANSEDCLFATRGRPKRINAGVRATIHDFGEDAVLAHYESVIISPRREHSRKPDAARERLVDLMGDVKRIELFARQLTPGWDVWGKEAPNHLVTE